MNEAQKLFFRCMSQEYKADVHYAKSLQNKRAAKEAAKELFAMFKGRTAEELKVIWSEQFDEIAKAEYMNRPNALEPVNRQVKKGKMYKEPRWKSNLRERRNWFIKRAQGKRTSVSMSPPEYATNGTIIKYLRRYCDELLNRSNDLTPLERKLIHQEVLLKLADVLHPYKDEIKRTKLVCFCGKKNTEYNGIDCSNKCERQRIEWEAHKRKTAAA